MHLVTWRQTLQTLPEQTRLSRLMSTCSAGDLLGIAIAARLLRVWYWMIVQVYKKTYLSSAQVRSKTTSKVYLSAMCCALITKSHMQRQTRNRMQTNYEAKTTCAQTLSKWQCIALLVAAWNVDAILWLRVFMCVSVYTRLCESQ